MIKLAHRAIVVSDMAISEKFYCDALGFSLHQDLGILDQPELAKTWELPQAKALAKIFKRSDGPTVELIQFLDPFASGPRERRSTLQYGLVHISFYCDDIDAWADRIVAAGGQVHEETRAYFEGNDTTLLYCTDPDGTRVELMKSPGVAERFSHGGICVDNIEASMEFYQLLGFSPVENYVLDGGYDWLAVINEVPGIKLRAQMVRNADGDVIELLKVFEPACFGPRERQPFNRFGLTHLAFLVDDQETLVQNLLSAGGQHVTSADARISGVQLTQMVDVDGVRVELIQPIAA